VQTPAARNRRSFLRVEELNSRALPAFLDPGFGGLIGDDTLAVTSWIAPDVDVSSGTLPEGDPGEETAFDITVALAAEDGFDPAICYLADFEAEIPLVADGEDGTPPDDELVFVVDPLPAEVDAGEPFYDRAVCYMADPDPAEAEDDPVLGDPVPAEELAFDPAIYYMVDDPASPSTVAAKAEVPPGRGVPRGAPGVGASPSTVAAKAEVPPAGEIDPAVFSVTDFGPAVSEPPTDDADEVPAVAADIETAEVTVYSITLSGVAPESDGTLPEFEPAVATDFGPLVLLLADEAAGSPPADAPDADTAPATETELIFVGDLFPAARSRAFVAADPTTEQAPTGTPEPTLATFPTVTGEVGESEVSTSSSAPEAVATGFPDVSTGLNLGIDGTREAIFVG